MEASHQHKKLSKVAKRRKKGEKEREMREAELKRARGEVNPTSVTEYEQLVLGEPNSSQAWIRYLAFLIGQGDLDGARALAQRALQTIHYRWVGASLQSLITCPAFAEHAMHACPMSPPCPATRKGTNPRPSRMDHEKFNVWVAQLNLENLYGSEDSTLQLLSKALAHTDARRMYLAATDIFEKSGKGKLVEQCLKAMCRKFSENAEVGGSVGGWVKELGCL
jgi:rRNA biogenesis protein RRP5